MLWLTGKVGAGKSVLTSSIVDRYQVNENNQDEVDEGFAFFYYSKNNKDVTDDPVINVLRSFLRQLAQVPHYVDRIFDDLASQCLKMDKAQRAFTPDFCRKQISTIVNALPRTTLILDSLDELEPQHMQEIIGFFVELVNDSKRPVKIFLSSRFTTDIYNQVHRATDKYTRMDIEEQNQGDIESFVRERTTRFDCHWRDDEVKDKVVEKISKGANGMFRWAFLQIAQLIECDSPEDVETRLGQLPKGLTAAYDELYAKPGSHDKIYLQRAVKWVMHVHEKLSTERLLSAVQLRLSNDHDDPVLGTRDRRLSEQKLESICRYLIVKDAQGRWAFSHASVQEYFIEEHTELTNEAARIEVAKLSLLVLMESHQWSLEDDVSRNWLYEPYPKDSLEYYVSQNWMVHIGDVQGVAGGNKQISKLLKRFMISQNNPCHSTPEYQRWVRFLKNTNDWCDKWYYLRDLWPADIPAFGIVALGITLDEKEWAKTCLKLTLEEPSPDGFNTLALAAAYGRAELCGSLIKMGSNPNKILPSDTGVLDIAIIKNHTTSVKELLLHGADPNVDTGCRPLCRAAKSSSREILELLIDHGALPDGLCSRCAFRSALAAAAGSDRQDAADILIKAGATVDLRLDSDYFTPLVAAAHDGSIEVAKLLINHHADVKIKAEPINSGLYGGVLGAAFCSYRAHEMVPYLIEEGGADPNRIIEDLMGRDSLMHREIRSKKRELCEWLFKNDYLNPDEIQGLEIGSSGALSPLVRIAKRFIEKRSS